MRVENDAQETRVSPARLYVVINQNSAYLLTNRPFHYCR
jgi:hypothetical protein